jgi:hypothetical protein
MSSNCEIYKVGTTAVKTAYVNPGNLNNSPPVSAISEEI